MAGAVMSAWIAFNATPEDAPLDTDVWHITNGTQTVQGFTQGHAESVAAALNARDLMMALSLSQLYLLRARA
jgi:hypothetical protein